MSGNAICKDLNDRSAAYSEQYQNGPKTPAAVQTLLDTNGDMISQSVEALRALSQPPGDEERLAAMYADVDTLADYSHQMAQAAGRGEETVMNQVQAKGKRLQSALNRSFTEYGLTECGKGS